MSRIAGVEILAAIKKAVVWGTAVACGANDGMYFLADSVSKEDEVDVDDSLGKAHSKDGDRGPIKVEGDRPFYLRYDGGDLLLALFMGIAGVPTQQAATAAYAYTYGWSDDLMGLFLTFAKSMKSYVSECPTEKIVGLTIKGEVGGPLEAIAHVISIDKVTDSTTNDLASFANVTFFETSNRVLFSHGVSRINDQSGAALDSGDQIYPNSFELTAMRKLKGEYTGEYVTDNDVVQDLIDEPSIEGQPEINLKLNFARHTEKTYLEDLGNDKRKKMDLTFTGGLIEDTYYREFKLEFANLQMLNDDPVDEQGIIKEPLEFLVHGNEAAPTGMDFTAPFKISGINKRTADPLA